MKQPQIGDRVKLSAHHWCRAHDFGMIVAELPKSHYEILFDKQSYGYANGTMLSIDIKDFEVIE